MTESITMLQTRMATENGFTVSQYFEGFTYTDVAENAARGMFAKGWARKATEGEISNLKKAGETFAIAVDNHVSGN